MVFFYFSGTGNSRFVAERFCALTDADCHSIEQSIDFDGIIRAHERIGFCYPVYGSCVPRPMREFVLLYAEALTGKQFLIFCTQLFFSGDGAHALCAFLPGGETGVVYAEHIRMPNNICNFAMFRVTNGAQNDRCLYAARQKLMKAADEVSRGVLRRRGFHPLSILLGKTQSVFWPKIEARAANDVRVSVDCNRCGVCVRLCPTGNLALGENGILQQGKCAVCYRCVNACPQCAITTLIHTMPRRQYHGISK